MTDPAALTPRTAPRSLPPTPRRWSIALLVLAFLLPELAPAAVAASRPLPQAVAAGPAAIAGKAKTKAKKKPRKVPRRRVAHRVVARKTVVLAPKVHKAAAPAAADTPEPDPETDVVEDLPGAVGAPQGPATPAELTQILRGAPGRPLAVALIVDAATGEVVLDLDAGKTVYPASVAKLFTTAAILRSWPADKELVTELRASPTVQGRAEQVAVVGSGDPTLKVQDLAMFAEALKKQGVARIGRLIVDGTVFDDRSPRGFDEKQTDAAFRAPVGGFQVEGSTVAVVVRPGAQVGDPPRVDVTPACGKAVVIRNEARTVKGRANGASVGMHSAGRQTEVVIKGAVGVNGRLVGSGRRRVADATYFAAGVWRAVLEERGIAVDGETVFAKASAELPVVATRKSPTLQKIVTVTNKTSHNGYAETLFKLTAVAHGHAPATAETAEASARKALDGLGIRWEAVKLGNGSGLYHANQVTCRAVVDLLRGMAKDSTGANYRQSMAIGGVDGTLRGRLHGAMKGRVQAKTGTLDDVVGLAGYLQAPDRNYVFAMFFNRVKGSAGPLRATQDRVLRRLSGQ